ncbi:MAG: hypothetical protein H0U21_14590 [Acidimicrobiia bacterium]|nr:hypothetical protein [Acidimicrobiia bacterium]
MAVEPASPKRRRIGLILAAVLVLVAGAAAVFVAVGGDDNDESAATTSATAVIVAPADLPAATRTPDGLGDDDELDALARRCYEGDMRSCDRLWEDAEQGTEYLDYGDTCAGRQPAATQAYCVNTFPD